MSRIGQLLIAHPNLPKNNWFHQTVIYIYEDNNRIGTLGLCLNVPTTASVKALMNSKGILHPEGISQVYKGGPVNESAIILLHSDEWASANTTPAGPSYSLSSDDHMMQRLAEGDQPAYWRLFVGLCGWTAGQLDMEMRGTFPYSPENSWLTCTANDEILFQPDPIKQYETALEMSSNQMFDRFF